MKRGFYNIMAAQFFSSLADNALLIAAIALLKQLDGPAWMVPLLKIFFHISYVALAPFVGPLADAWPKGKVMFSTNTIKIVGCLILLFYEFFAGFGFASYAVALFAYGIVGLGAAAYAPAKYGIVTELLPPEKLVMANAWLEGLTVISAIVGIVIGSYLINPNVSKALLSFDMPYITTSIDTPAEAAISVIVIFYVVAAAFNLSIPDTGARYEKQNANPLKLINNFGHCFSILWKDKLGQISLAVTTLLWGAGATLQLIVLRWSEQHLGLPPDKASASFGIFALGTAIGAVIAGRFIPLKSSIRVLPAGIVMGVLVMMMTVVHYMPMVFVLLVTIGAIAGFFVVPMNALLQHRGHVLLSAGNSIAVQNFNENFCILSMLAFYALLLSFNIHINTAIIIFGTFVSLAIAGVMLWHRRNQRVYGNSEQLIGIEKGETLSHFDQRPY